MKPFHIALGSVGIAILLVGVFSIKSRISTNNDEREITKLIGEYKAMGIPTNGDELVKKLPASENAWTEIGPLLLDQQSTGVRFIFHSPIAREMTMTCGKSDLPLIKKYLAENQTIRDKISAILTSKSKLQVPHDYNDSYMTMLPELNAFTSLSWEYCLAAYSAGMDGNLFEAKRNLGFANYFAKHCLERPEYVSTAHGASIRNGVLQTSLRIIEANPSLTSELQAFTTSPNFVTKPDMRMTIRGEFVAQIGLPRYYDLPEMDRPSVPFFLEGFFPARNNRNIEIKGHAHPGDYMPTSHKMRKQLRLMLESWKPLMQDLSEDRLPTQSRFSKEAELSLKALPKELSFLSPILPTENSSYVMRMGLAEQGIEMNKAIYLAIDAKRSSGKYPSSVTIPNPPQVPVEKFAYIANEKGVVVRSEIRSFGETQSLSFPASLSIDPKVLAKYRQRVADYRNGIIGRNGTREKWGGAKRPIP